MGLESRNVMRVCAAAASALVVSASGLQAPHADWRTLSTAHYRIHYPPPMADWAQEVASRIEGIHRKVVALVGYESPEPIQVLLADPMAEPNGLAMPLLHYPYVILWRTEPRSDDPHGNTLSSWTEELVSHEMTHIHHLTRPRRLPTQFDTLFGLPIGPLALKCPRWVTEGYATLAEGRITGSGRPHSALRAAMLRQWARQGKLPPYGALDGSQGYLGRTMAYLVGSAYLEWLERQRLGQPDILQRLWKHLASRRNRSFDAAFQATFGFSAQDGYQRFQAETAHDALEWEGRLKAQGLREGALFLRTDATLRDLAVSPDGTRLLASLEAPRRGGLRVWDLADAKAKVEKVRPDPFNGVEDAPREAPAHALAAELPALDHRLPRLGEWVDDRTIRFQLKRADPEGTLHLGPALWRLSGPVDRDPQRIPLPHWKTLLPVHQAGSWVLFMEDQTVPLPGQVVGRAFIDEPRSALWAACEVEGVWNIVKVPYDREGGRLRFGNAQVMTRTVSAAWNPAPSPDGSTLYFTALNERGMEIRKLDLALPPLQEAQAPAPRILSPRTVMPPAVEAVDLPRTAKPVPSVPYSATRDPWIQFASGLSLTPSGESLQVGATGSDLLGRLSWQALAGLGDGAGPRGGMAGFSSTAWPWKPSMTLFTSLERPSLQRFAPVNRDRQRWGAELAFTRDIRSDTPFWFSPVVASERVKSLEGEGADATRSLLGLRTGMTSLWARGEWGASVTPVIQWFPGVTSGAVTNRWNLLRADLALKLETPVLPVTLHGEGGRIGNSRDALSPEAFHLGGVITSLVPQSLDSDRVEQPALPDYLATGDRFLRWRGELGTSLRAYVEGTSLWNAGQERPSFTRVAGLEFSLDNPLGIASEEVLKRMRFQLGVHRPLDGIMKNRTVATLTLVIRP